MISPFLHEFDWDSVILAVNPDQLAVPKDEWLQRGLLETTPIHHCKAWSLRWAIVPGLGTLDLRARGAIKRLGTRLLQQQHFDLIYFSTTVFSLFKLGPYWKRRFGIPFVLDYQDPWVTDYYRKNRKIIPPGGRYKYSVVDFLARRSEPDVIRECSGITSVSEAYAETLKARYSFASKLDNLTLPFPGAQRDLQRVESEQVVQKCFATHDDLIHWVCVGVSGPIMAVTLEALFRAIAKERDSRPQSTNQLRLHFIGTSYAPSGTGVSFVKPIAERFGLGELVTEKTDRIPYSEALACLKDANMLLALGSNDDSYNASKLMPYLMARKPLLTVFHQNSPAAALLRKLGGSTLVTFKTGDSPTEIADRICSQWFQADLRREAVPMNESLAEPYSDRGQARLICQFFESILARELESR